MIELSSYYPEIRKTCLFVSVISSHMIFRVSGVSRCMALSTAEAESLETYNRKHLEMSFEPETPPKWSKTHSPNEENHTWSHNNALAMLQNATTDKKVNWSATARTLGIPGKNAGQVLKEVAVSHGVDVARLEHRDPPQLPRLRNQKNKLPGGEISIPTLPSVHEITIEQDHLMQTGEFIKWRALYPIHHNKISCKSRGERGNKGGSNQWQEDTTP